MKKNFENIRKIIYILFLTTYLAGCGTIHKVSFPTIGKKILGVPPYSRIKLEGIDLYLFVFNDKIIKQDEIFGIMRELTLSPFEIRIILIPHKKGFSFEPQKITLKIENKNIALATADGHLEKRRWQRWMGANDISFRPIPQYPISKTLDDHFIIFEEINLKYWYSLVFEIPPPSPETNFSIDLSKALKYNSASVINKVDFEEYKWVDGGF